LTPPASIAAWTIMEMMKSETIVIFDLDGTITSGDSYVAYLRGFLMRHWRRLPRSTRLLWDVFLFGLNRIDNTRLKRQFLMQVLAGTTRDEVEAWTTCFVESYLERALKPEALRRIERHRRDGHVLVLASASLDIYVDAIGARLGFDRVIATRAEWDSRSILTGELAGPNLRGYAKVDAIEKELEEQFKSRPRIVAYADHHADLPLLLFADEGVAVDPSRSLLRFARQHHLRIEDWRGL
jgi:phosphatidylglycerophosphatase C